MPEPANDGALGLVLKEINEFRKEMNEQIRHLVTQEAFNAEQRRVDQRFTDLAGDISKEESERKESVKEVKDDIAKTSIFIRWVIGLVATLGIAVVTFWISLGGPA